MSRRRHPIWTVALWFPWQRWPCDGCNRPRSLPTNMWEFCVNRIIRYHRRLDSTNESTDNDVTQDEEGVKTVAPPYSSDKWSNKGMLGIAVCSLWQYKWRHRGDFLISPSNPRYSLSKGWASAPQVGKKSEKNYFPFFFNFLIGTHPYMPELPWNQ